MMRNAQQIFTCLLLAVLFISFSSRNLFSDTFSYLDEQGGEVTTQAVLAGSGRGFHALERWDGQIQIVPTAAITRRENPGDPEPITVQQMKDLLEQKFTPELCRIEIKKSFVVAMVLSAPLDRSAEGRAETFLKKASRFMDNVDGVFLRFARSSKLPFRELRYPLVLLIFESDDDFNAYADEATGGRGLSAGSILGFYSSLTNWLAVRMSSCDSFEVPLHEAIHQQVYNRMLQRLAPIPKWFDEGIATGFEGSGERINVSPGKVNARYGYQSTRLSPQLEWSDVVGQDVMFTADVLAGEAYTTAWCLHWLLVSEYKDAYRQYVEELSRREPLATLTDSEQLEAFESIFHVSVRQLQTDFPRQLQLAARRQNISLVQPAQIGRTQKQQALGEYDIHAVRRGDLQGQLQVGGTIKNISPLRPMTFYITVETDAGVYGEWLAPQIKPNQSYKLQTQFLNKRIPGRESAPGAGNAFRVYVRSTAADSRQAENWLSGGLPGPVTMSP